MQKPEGATVKSVTNPRCDRKKRGATAKSVTHPNAIAKIGVRLQTRSQPAGEIAQIGVRNYKFRLGARIHFILPLVSILILKL